MAKFLFHSFLALLMLGLVFGLVGLYLWEVTGEGEYTAPDRGSDNRQQGITSVNSSGSSASFNNFDPQWSPDGQFIAFTSDRMQNDDVWVMSSTGSTPLNLTADSPSHDINPVWSPDGQLIAFESERLGNADIWMMKSDGSNPVNLTPESVDPDISPQWSSDGQFIAYLSQSSQRFQLRVVHVESGEITIVAEAPDRNYVAFDWSPNLAQIVVVETMVPPNDEDASAVPASTQVSIRSIDGSILQTYHPTRPGSDVKWSPDGSRFLLEVTYSRDSSVSEFIVMSFDGSEQELIVPEPYGISGDWSPDGTMIVFSNTHSLTNNVDEEVSSILVSNADGSNLRNVSEDFYTSESPAWSPDGTKIAFVAMQDEVSNFDIWVMNPDGSNPMNLTGGN